MAGVDGVPGRPCAQPHAFRPRPGQRPARPDRAGNSRHHPGRTAHPGEDRARGLRRLPQAAGAARLRLALACGESAHFDPMTPDEYCQQKAAASGSSFYYAFLFLPSERRRAITALYAFCREVDDVVDETGDAQLAAAKLAWWRAEVANLFAGKPQHPVTKALAPHLAACDITEARLNEIIVGMEMDLTQTRYLDWPALETYCYRVASVVGLLAAGIFGYRDERTLEYARALGIAFQLTNIIRDVGEDARKNRIYLPMADLKQFGVPAADILNAKETPEFTRLMSFEAARARDHYEE